MNLKNFNARFWKYFGIVLGVMFLLAIPTAIFQKMEDFMEYNATFGSVIHFALLSAMAMLPIIVISALSVAFTVSFRRLEKGELIKSLSAAMVVTVAFAALVWVFDQRVQPRIMAHSLSVMIDVRDIGLSAEESSPSSLMNKYANTSTPEALQNSIDSLQQERDRIKKLDKGSEYYLGDVDVKLSKYRFEVVKRRVNAIALVVSSLLFALLGYASRKSSVAKILSIAAIVIVCVYAVSWIADGLKIIIK